MGPERAEPVRVAAPIGKMGQRCQMAALPRRGHGRTQAGRYERGAERGARDPGTGPPASRRGIPVGAGAGDRGQAASWQVALDQRKVSVS